MFNDQGNNENILLVEDDPTFGKLTLRKIEKETGISVTWVKTLKDTVNLLEKYPSFFTAAVLDFILPDSARGEIVDAVTEKNIPSIVFTGSISPNIRKFVWSRNVIDYILKDDPNCMDYLVFSLNKFRTNKNRKVIIIDDSAFFRKIISDILKIQNYKILTASNAEEGLEIIKNNKDIQLVLTDFNMPGMNGWELCKEIRKFRKKDELAVIGISSEGDETMAARFIKSGANDFIVKQSFIREEFYCRINQCLENLDLIYFTKQAAIKDYLTGLYNRRYFFELGDKTFSQLKSENLLFAFVMLDIDYFKQVNDTYGHDSGDLILKKVAARLQDSVSDNETAARIGGEEFALLIPEKTQNPEDFKNLVYQRVEKLRSEIEKMQTIIKKPDKSLNVTISIGISFNDAENFAAMFKSADEKLYQAKESGRNMVVW